MELVEKNKSDIKDEVIPVIKHIQSRHPISFIRCDNAGENQALDQSLDPLVITLTFEYTPRDTPQHNGVVERKYQTLYQQMSSMIMEMESMVNFAKGSGMNVKIETHY